MKVVFELEDGRVINETAAAGETVLSAARRAGVSIDAPCAGNGTCGKCRIRIENGEVSGERGKSISKKDFTEGYRLACISEIVSDVTIFVPGSALAWQNRIRVADFSSKRAQESFEAMKKALSGNKYKTDSIFTELTLKLDQPSLNDAQADKERVITAAARELGALDEQVSFTMQALRKLPQMLRDNDFYIGVLVRKFSGPLHDVCSDNQYQIFDIFEGAAVQVGVCIDIGTTTVSGALVDLKTKEFVATGNVGNTQIRYGADVISRLVESARGGGVSRLRDAVTKECIAPLISKMCSFADIIPSQISRASIVGNTTMMHLFLGVYGNNIRLEPYVPAFFNLKYINGYEAGIGIHPEAEVLIAPSVGSYVGGDITAGVFATGMARKESFSLFIDLGTNGEIVFGNKDFLLSCACSAGSAFEGGEIDCGMRATDGAITSLVIDHQTFKPEYTVIGEEGQLPAGICGSGLIDTISELFKAGMINAKGKFIYKGPGIYQDEWGFTYFTIVSAENSMTGNDIYISDADIDNFIRAKGAVFSAIYTLMKSLNMGFEVIDEIFLAGGIGSGINIGNAVNIGMFPKLPEGRYNYIGNTALSGAYAMLVSDKAKERIDEIAKGMTYLELSSVPGYMDEFIAASFLPHTDASLFE